MILLTGYWDSCGGYKPIYEINQSYIKQEMSLKKTNGVGLKKRRKYNTRLSTCS